jgi:hypothetical protein
VWHPKTTPKTTPHQPLSPSQPKIHRSHNNEDILSFFLMNIEPPTESIANNGHDLASIGTDPPASCHPEQATLTSLALSDDELKRQHLQVLDCVQAEEVCQEAQQQNHEREKTEEKASNQNSDTRRPSSSSVMASSEPGISRNSTSRPTNVAMTARPVPREYRREKGVDQNLYITEAGLPLRGPGAYPIRPPTMRGAQDESSHNEDDEDAMTSTDNDVRNNEVALLVNDSESALDAQVVPERDLNQEVQQKMDAITIDPIAVAKSDNNANDDAHHKGPYSCARLNKSSLLITLGILLVLVAIGSAIGIVASKSKNKRSPTIAQTLAPTFVSNLELARVILSPLSGHEALWDESSPQYKALWWIVHDDPAKMMIEKQDESQSQSLIVERYVMAVLYFATDGPNWLKQVGFLSNSSICDWQDAIEFSNGVQCNDHGSAVTLSMCKFAGIAYSHIEYTYPPPPSPKETVSKLCNPCFLFLLSRL